MKSLPKLLVATALALGAGWASAQSGYPDKPVKVVVPFAPGGSFDLIARELAVRLAERWKQPVIIDNRAGAGGNIGAQAVIAAPADGYTLLFWGDGVLANPLLYPKPPFDAIRDLAGVALVATTPQVLVSQPGKGPRTIKEVLASKTPLNYGTAGNGTPGHLAAESIKREGAAQLTPRALQRRRTGADRSARWPDPAGLHRPAGDHRVHPQRSGPSDRGDLEGAAQATARRADRGGDDSRLRGRHLVRLHGAQGRAGGPSAPRVADDLRAVMADGALQARLVEAGFVPTFGSPKELDAKMVRDLAFWRAQIAKSGARAE